MLNSLLQRFKGNSGPVRTFAVPEGQRIYAVGDIHGRLDLLDTLLELIDEDHERRGDAKRQLIFLGDLMDRGPQSAQVIDRLIEVKHALPDTRFLTGNHEEIMLLALDGNREAIKLFDRIGGYETMKSYGISDSAISRSDYDELRTILDEAVPKEHRDFLSQFEDLIVIGDYAFVHAGISPSRPLSEQKISDLRWIRRQFLNHDGAFEKMIVHGHTITEDVEETSNRIGIDTGAFSSGRLTAIGLESTDRWFLQTG